MPDNVRNHLASAGYLRGFTDESRKVGVVNVRSSQTYAKPPEEVAFRKYFWGREQRLRDQVEHRLSAVETEVPRILRELVSGGPPAHSSCDRRLLLEFLAMHFVRNPTWREIISGVLDREIPLRGHDSPEWSELRARLCADRYWVDALLRQIPQAAGVLGSMHWALISFEGPWLITCDQPVVPVGLIPDGVRVPVAETPGLLETIELRFVVDPWHALILSWHDAPDWTSWSNRDLPTATDINRSVAARADAEYFHYRECAPRFVAPPWRPTDECRPISPALNNGYWRGTAIHSERRRRASANVLEAIEQQKSAEIRTVIIAKREAA